MKHISQALAEAMPPIARKAKPVHLNAVQRAIEASRKLPPEDRANLQRICTVAFVDFRAGRDGSSNWRNLVDALNVAEALAHFGICSDEASRDRITAGQAALGAVAQRKADGGTWTLRVSEIHALDDALWLHGIQLEHCSLGEYQRATKRVRDLTQQALAGNAGPGVQVIQAPLKTGAQAPHASRAPARLGQGEQA